MSRKKNPLSVWHLRYNTRYYWTHPWCLFRDLYLNCRNFYRRGRYGFAYTDVWDFCDWYPRVGAEALRYLAEHNTGYPGIKPWETPEEWREYLNYLANRLQRCADSQDICFTEDRNEYAEDFHDMMEKKYRGRFARTSEMSDEDKELRTKYFNRMKELEDVDCAYDVETFRWVGEDIRRIWD